MLPSVIEYLWSLVYFWNAYPADLNGVLDFVEENNIEDVIVISGDSHSSMVDDGTNAGLPELSASGLASEDEGYLNYQLDSVMDLLFYEYGTIDSLWNGGGNGVDNNNFSDSYGTMEFFGKDSVMLCAMDETGAEMGCIRLYHSTNPLSVGSTVYADKERFKVYPNPSSDQFTIEWMRNYQPSKTASLELHHSSGALIQTWGSDMLTGPITVDVRSLAPGSYLFSLRDGARTDTKSVVVKP